MKKFQAQSARWDLTWSLLCAFPVTFERAAGPEIDELWKDVEPVLRNGAGASRARLARTLQVCPDRFIMLTFETVP